MHSTTTASVEHPVISGGHATAKSGRRALLRWLAFAGVGAAVVAGALNERLTPRCDTQDDTDGPFGGGAGERAFKPMMVNEIAKQMAHGGGLGLAEPVYQQMLRLQEQRR